MYEGRLLDMPHIFLILLLSIYSFISESVYRKLIIPYVIFSFISENLGNLSEQQKYFDK